MVKIVGRFTTPYIPSTGKIFIDLASVTSYNLKIGYEPSKDFCYAGRTFADKNDTTLLTCQLTAASQYTITNFDNIASGTIIWFTIYAQVAYGVTSYRIFNYVYIYGTSSLLITSALTTGTK